MATSSISAEHQLELTKSSIQQHIAMIVDDLMSSLPAPEKLTREHRRGIIARYVAVLESNFMYWKAATLIALEDEQARSTFLENLHEKCPGSRSAMMRRFATAANASPIDKDALAVKDSIDNMCLFLGRLDGVASLVSMAFLENWIRKFMDYLAALATSQGSTDMEYADIHGVSDVAHSQSLFRAISFEMQLNPVDARVDIFEGVDLLCALVENIVEGEQQARAAA